MQRICVGLGEAGTIVDIDALCRRLALSGCKKWSQRRRQLRRSRRPIGTAVPTVRAHAVQNALGQGDCIPAVCRADTRRGARAHALNEVL